MQGHLRTTLLLPLCVTFQNAGALARPWARRSEVGGGFILMCPLGKNLTSLEEQPPLPQYYSPSLEQITCTPLVILYLAFYTLEVRTHTPGELRPESKKQWDLLPLHFQNDYHFGSSLLTLCILATSKKFESILAHPSGRFMEIAPETLK